MDQNSDNLEHGKQLGVVTCAVVLLTMNTFVLILVSLLMESVIFAASTTTTSLRKLATPTIGTNAACHYYLSSFSPWVVPKAHVGSRHAPTSRRQGTRQCNN